MPDLTRVHKGQLYETLKRFDLHVGPIAAPANGSRVLVLKSNSVFPVVSMAVQTSSGTCNVGLKINGTLVNFDGGTSVAASSVFAEDTVHSAGIVNKGSRLELVITGASSPVNLVLSIAAAQSSGTTTILVDPTHLFAWTDGDTDFAAEDLDWKQQLIDAGVQFFSTIEVRTHDEAMTAYNALSATKKAGAIYLNQEFPFLQILLTADTATEYPPGAGDFAIWAPAAIPANDTLDQAAVRAEAIRQGVALPTASSPIADFKAIAIDNWLDTAADVVAGGAAHVVQGSSFGWPMESHAQCPIEGIMDASLEGRSRYLHDFMFVMSHEEEAMDARLNGLVRSLVEAQRNNTAYAAHQYNFFPFGMPVDFVSRWTNASYAPRYLGLVQVNPDFYEPDCTEQVQMSQAAAWFNFYDMIADEITDLNLVDADAEKPCAAIVYVPPMPPIGGSVLKNHFCGISGTNPEMALLGCLRQPTLDTPNVQAPQFIYCWDNVPYYFSSLVFNAVASSPSAIAQARVGMQKFCLKMPLVGTDEPIGDSDPNVHDAWNLANALSDAVLHDGLDSDVIFWDPANGGNQLDPATRCDCSPGGPLDEFVDWRQVLDREGFKLAYKKAVTKAKVTPVLAAAAMLTGS